jgi:hypothetical protein
VKPDPKGEAPSVVEVVPISPPPDPPIAVTPTVVPPPEIDLAVRIEATKLIEVASGLGLHFRVDVPVSDPEPLMRELDKVAGGHGRAQWSEVCRTISQARICVGTTTSVIVVTTPSGRVQFDFIEFAIPGTPLAGDRPATIRAAVEARPAEQPALAELRGTAAAFVDATAIARAYEDERLGSALGELRWSSTPASEQISERIARLDAVARMGQGTVLFDGVQLELFAVDDRLHAVARWHARAATREMAAELLGDRPTHATVPTYAALCEGALLCARTGSLPLPAQLSDRLATGIWAQDERGLAREIDIDDEGPALHLLAASWPNLLAAVARWPAAEVGDGMEGAMVRNGIDAVARIEGFGLSVRSLSVTRNRAQSDYAAYARTTAVDNAMVRGLLGFAEIRLQESTLAGVDGPIQLATLPEDDMPLVVATYDERTPITVDGKDVVFGWLALVDGGDRMGWLLGLPRELATGPRAYVEVPDIGRVFASVSEVDRDLEVLRSWLQGRGFRAALFFDRGEPRIEAMLGAG